MTLTRESPPVRAASPVPAFRPSAALAVGATLILICLVCAPRAARAQDADTPTTRSDAVPCAERADREPAVGRAPTSAADARLPSLRCVDLVATPGAEGASGTVELGRVPSPFGVAVTPDGRQRYDLTAWIDGLPAPDRFGPYRTYVAWATTLVLEPVVKLGEVSDGRNELGPVDFDKFMIWISAEPSADVEERTGPLILRGRSPSSLMVSHDLLAQAPSAEQNLRAARDRRDGRAANGAGGSPWSAPPPYPRVPMLPGVRNVRPAVSRLHLEAPADRNAPEARPRQVVELPDGGTLDLTADYVRRAIAGRSLTMLAFNGQHPGPLLKVRRESTIFVNFINRTPFPTTVHWHGIRLDNRFDGVPGVTQEPVPPGETFRYRIRFPDAGLYWYHPHQREDVQQELGLYGNLMVESPAEDHYGPANREEVLMLDDLLLGEEGLVSFGAEASNHTLMGRFGNLLLVNGEPGYELEVGRGAVVRFHLTNAASTRTFNLSFVRAPGGRGGAAATPPGRPAGPAEEGTAAGEGAAEPLPLKVVASDVSRFEREERVRNVVLAPAERYVVEARFPEPGTYHLVNRVRGINHRQGVFLAERTRLGAVRVLDRPAEPDHEDAFSTLRVHDEVVDDIDRYRGRFDDPPDRELVLDVEVEGLPAPVRQSMLFDRTYFNPVEWSGTMPMMNWTTTGREVRWILRDPATGRENTDIDWRFEVGDVVRLRIRNERDAFHAMQHPIHIHGQRFLVLERDGVPNPNLAWKDTALLPVGSTTDILLEISNPGRWMVHCHIAEHLESGMKLVLEAEGGGGPP